MNTHFHFVSHDVNINWYLLLLNSHEWKKKKIKKQWGEKKTGIYLNFIHYVFSQIILFGE